MLVAQAWTDDLTLVTADRRLPEYGVPVLLARQ
jgi:PIN domain nuclease of toxin-antitoxin system